MKKALRILGKLLVWIIVIVAVAMMIFTVISVNVFDRNDRDLFGYKAFIVKTDSMAPDYFDAGDLIFVKEVDPYTIKEGDVITFLSVDDQNYNQVITHKVKEVTKDATGELAFVTYGTATGDPDRHLVQKIRVLGKYTGTSLNEVGTFFNFLQTPRGYIICIAVPFVLLIVYQGVNCVRLFRKYKKEQTENMENERARIEDERKKLEEERIEAAKMMEELRSLKDQLAPVVAGEAQNTETEPEASAEETAENDSAEKVSEEKTEE